MVNVTTPKQDRRHSTYRHGAHTNSHPRTQSMTGAGYLAVTQESSRQNYALKGLGNKK